MKKRGSKVLIIVFITLILIVISGGAFAYAYLYTDTFKTEQELFTKFLVQNVAEIGETLNFTGINETEEKLKQSKYEESMSISYTEAGKEEPNAKITIDTQNDPINKKHYGMIGLVVDGIEETLKLEYMNENEAYSLRFTNAVEEFLTVKNSNLKQFAKNLGIEEEIVQQIPDSIDFEEFPLEELKLTDEEKNVEMIKYTSLIYNNIAKEKYTKSKDVVITLNGKTITTNAYILTLNMQDLKNIAIQLLETIKQDEILLSKLEVLDEMLQEYIEETIKESFIEAIQKEIDDLKAKAITKDESITITLYEQNKKTVRIKIEQELEYITIDTIEVDGKKQIDVNYTKIDENNNQYSDKVTFIKENDNKLNIRNTVIDGEEQQTTELSIEFIGHENNTKLGITLIDAEGGKIVFNRNINFVENIVYNVTIDNSNNIVLNDLTLEQMTIIFNALEPALATEYLEPLGLYDSTLDTSEEETFSEPEVSLENMSYSQNSQVSIEKTAVSPENFKPSTMPSENIANTGNKILSLLRTISTIAIVIMLVG